MTDTQALVDFAAARDQIEAFGAKVGLRRSDSLPITDNMEATPDGTCLWSSDYARLLLWPCGASDATAIEYAARRGQAWFDEVLVQSERTARGRPIDGYLVLALPEEPRDEALEDMRRLELSAQVCRKHLIWPSQPADADHEPGRWRRITNVTVLGLPDAEDAPAAELHWPELDEEAQALWGRLAEQGVGPTVVQDEAP